MELRKCPVCGREGLVMRQEIRKVEFFGKMMILSLVCSFCGFKHNDVFSLEFKEPLCYTLKVESEDDLNARVIRASSGTIEIKELGIEIEPGPASQGFITNVEGVLERIENVLISQTRCLKGKRLEKVKKLLKKVRKMREGKMSFVIKIKDPFGNSALLSKKAKKRKLSEKELKKLKTGFLILTLR